LSEEQCALYRHFNAQGVLLYVGISLRPLTRTREHITLSGWANEITNVAIEYLPTRKEAMAAEAKAVIEENPLYNIRLRKPKKEPTFISRKLMRLAAVTEVCAEEARINLSHRILNFAPLYLPKDAANALGISVSILKQEIALSNIATVLIPSPRAEKMNTYITGWQLIDWLESRELKTIKGAN